MKVDACEELKAKLRKFLHSRQLHSLLESSLTVGLYYIFKYIRGKLYRHSIWKLVLFAKKLARFLGISIPPSVEIVDGDKEDKERYVEQQETRIAETILERLEHPPATSGTDCEDGVQIEIAYLFHDSGPHDLTCRHYSATRVDVDITPAKILHSGYKAHINEDGIITSIDID